MTLSTVGLSSAKSGHDVKAAAPPDHKRYFIEKLGLSERLMERCLGEALSAGGEYADLYFESVTSTSLGIDEGLVKTASQGISLGCGIRVVSGERTGFAFTDDLSSERLLTAARTAALIASGPAKDRVSGFRHIETPSLYPIAGLSADGEIEAQARAHQARRQGRTRFRPAHHAGSRRHQRRNCVASSSRPRTERSPATPSHSQGSTFLSSPRTRRIPRAAAPAAADV